MEPIMVAARIRATRRIPFR